MLCKSPEKGVFRLRKMVWLSLVACLTMLVTSPVGLVHGETVDQYAAAQKITDTGMVSVSNDNLTLTFDPATCYITVTQRHTGAVWQSNPEDPRSDSVASGMNKTNLMSQLVVSYTTDKATQREINNYAASIVRHTYKAYQLPQGVRVDFEFEREGFTIPVCYTLDEDGFNASILFSEITETSTNHLITVSFLPFFGTASKRDKGYLFVPDGSGALINFNNKKTDYPAYEKEVYGHDQTLTVMYETTREQLVYLPVFGMKKADNAFLAVIEEGDGQARIRASVSGVTTDFNTVNAVATYRVADRIYLLDQLSGNKDVIYTAKDPTGASQFRVKYYFLSGDDADYSGMARTYRSQLEKQGMTAVSDGKAKLYVDLYGGVIKKKSFLGFLYKGKEPLTTFDDAIDILKDLQTSGVRNISAGYRNYSNDYFKRRVEVSMQPMAMLGGKKGFLELMSFADSHGVSLYPYADFFSFEKSGNSFSKYFDVNRGLDLGAALIYPKDLNTNIKTTKRAGYYLLKPTQFENAMSLVLKSINKYQAKGICFGDISHRLASDYNIGGHQRDAAMDDLIGQFQRAAKDTRVMLSAPNAYLIPYADEITNLPVTSSSYLLFDEDVPFIQMVLKGRIDYSGNPVNIGDTSTKTFLKHIETGSHIKYAFMKEDGKILLRTEMDYLYGAKYDNYKDQAVSQYQELSKVADIVQDSRIVSHRWIDKVARIEYTNGTIVYVNYTDKEYTAAEGIVVPAMWYNLFRKEPPSNT